MRLYFVAPGVASFFVFMLQIIESVKKERVYLNQKIIENVNTVNLFGIKSGISVDRCIQECKRRKRCSIVNYHQNVQVCYMVSANPENTVLDVTDNNGFIYAKKSDWNMTTPDEQCADCSDTHTCLLDENPRCLITGCGIPPDVDNTIILGNRFDVGSILKYECERIITEGSNNHITCQENGDWTEPRIQCIYQCRDGWILNNTSCYLFVIEAKYWNDAKTNCEQINAHLVDIGNQDENIFLNNLIGGTTVHIGLNDKEVEHDFRWSDNSQLDLHNLVSNWYNNEPNNAGNEDCVFLRNNRLYDCDCDQSYLQGSICEYEV